MGAADFDPEPRDAALVPRSAASGGARRRTVPAARYGTAGHAPAGEFGTPANLVVVSLVSGGALAGATPQYATAVVRHVAAPHPAVLHGAMPAVARRRR